MQEVWIQLIIGIVAFLTAFLSIFRYMVRNFTGALNTQSKDFLALIENKNGHAENISTEFSKSVKEISETNHSVIREITDKNTASLNEVTRVLAGVEKQIELSAQNQVNLKDTLNNAVMTMSKLK